MSDGFPALESALQLQQTGEYIAAERVLREFLRSHPESGDGLHLMGLCLHAQGRHEDALAWIEDAITVQPREAMFLTNAGIVALSLSRLEAAARFLEGAIAANPLHADAFNNLALVREQQGELADAILLLEKATLLNPDSALVYSNMGNVLRGLGRMAEAITAYETAIGIEPTLAAAHNGYGNTLRQLDRRGEAVGRFEKAIALDPNYAEAHFNLALTRAAQGETDEAVSGLAAARLIRDDIRFRIADAGLMPVIASSPTQITEWRTRIYEKFGALLQDSSVVTGSPLQVSAMSFYLAYHGQNDRQIMERLAAFYRKAFPDLEWTAPHCRAPDRSDHGRVRVGVVSRYFGEHAVTWMIYGLLSGLPREKFEVTAVTFDDDRQKVSPKMAEAVDEVVTLPLDLMLAREGIAERAFDVLLYADIGMEPFSYFLAFARLAPVQCVTWGHPDTSGLESIDYYISNDLAEPENGQDSYTEKLVRLAGVQSWYPRLPRPTTPPDRALTGLPNTGTIYLCPQNPIKIHPEMDAALGDILTRDPAGWLVIFEASDPNWTQLLLTRWRHAFGDKFARVIVLPQRPLEEFVRVIAGSDVVLDTWPFGAGNVNYQTFAMGVPVVTLPGDWIRGRGTLAHYEHMGIAECIAKSPKDYADIALRLGTDPVMRAQIVDRIVENSDAVLEDQICVEALAEFLHRVAG